MHWYLIVTLPLLPVELFFVLCLDGTKARCWNFATSFASSTREPNFQKKDFTGVVLCQIQAIIKARASYYENQILECGTDYHSLWKLMNQLIGWCRATESLHLGTSKKRPEAFGEFFSSKIRLLRESLEAEASLKEVSLGDTDAIINFFPELLQPSSPFTLYEVKNLITESPTTTCKLDPLPCDVLKRFLHTLDPAIVDIVNISLFNGVFPPPKSRAVVILVMKKNSDDPEVL